ncbi:penicillin-binding protein 1A [Erythrobacter sp. EC-HK427]|uniref:penicillin-binding protein 1A n=1 Tax=Erythrobacter sp. EC-HK427 TaxID=2038396 RepID=UPI00125562F7|nr:transglycosylase domain-containing protein [Erythrobacter sp. EC-HK427]VVT16214.1 Penicillin-binding protein [Erythrobacter sp. EC-HK427]
MNEGFSDDMAETGVTRRISRGGQGAWNNIRNAWQTRRWFRVLFYALGGGFLLAVIGYFWLAYDLPDAETLLDYEPNLPTVVRGIDGEIVHRYERERRIELEYRDMPAQLLNAYISAEDETFWSHSGIDAGGFVGAVIDYVSKIGSGERAVGGSTITQQVAKNILVGDEYSITRKLREMILATRIESVLEKEDIITLYLNVIPLGRRSFGVQAASLAYFDKDVDELELHEIAFLAAITPAPERYGREANFEDAKQRRDFILSQMEDNGYITQEQMAAAQAAPLGVVQGGGQVRSVDAGYFLEEVRRQLIARFGEEAVDGENSVYAGGLWVRTSLDMELQEAARNSLRDAMLRYHGNRGWTGPIATIDPDDGSLTSQLASSYLGINYEDWRIGVVTQRNGGSATIGFADGEEAPLSGLPDGLEVGHVTAVSPSGNGFRVRAIPEISGGFVALDPHTGRVYAVQGGFDSRLGAFNRAVQANRQPGSTVKPFVYATGLDNGMTPASMIPDSQYCYYQGSNLGEKCFTNFGGSRGGGEYPMRYGLEQSKNLMTIHIAMDAGMENVIQDFRDVGLEPENIEYQPYPAFALGAGETTVMRITNAYAAMVNHGRLNEPTLIDYVQDRDGNVIYRADTRDCTGCNMAEWDGGPMPRFGRTGEQVMDARTAFQTVHMLTGVIERGTATRLNDLDIPLFGKTGTSTGPKDVWFVGGSPDIVGGVYLGFDNPRNLGGWVQAGNTAAPIFRQFVMESPGHWNGRPFTAPEGVRMVRIDRRTGSRVFSGWPTGEPTAAIIWEAFKPDTEPRRTQRQDDIDAMRQIILAQLRRQRDGPQRAAAPVEQEATEEQGNFAEEEGGIY